MRRLLAPAAVLLLLQALPATAQQPTPKPLLEQPSSHSLRRQTYHADRAVRADDPVDVDAPAGAEPLALERYTSAMTDAAAATPLPTAKELHHQNRISRHLATRATRARRLHERAALWTSTRANVGPGASRSRQVRPPAPRPPCRRHSLVRHVSDARLRALFAGCDTKLGAHSILVVHCVNTGACACCPWQQASLQRSSPALAMRIAPTHTIHTCGALRWSRAG